MTHVRSRYSMLTAFAAALFAVLMLTTQPAMAKPDKGNGKGGNQPCPEGTEQIAKFEVSESGAYVLESGDGVEVTGDAAVAAFSSDVPVGAIVVKGGRDAKVVEFDVPVTSGEFSNDGLVNGGGNTPDISNVKFCDGELPTEPEEPEVPQEPELPEEPEFPEFPDFPTGSPN